MPRAKPMKWLEYYRQCISHIEYNFDGLIDYRLYLVVYSHNIRNCYYLCARDSAAIYQQAGNHSFWCSMCHPDRSDGRRTSRWESHLGSFTPGGGKMLTSSIRNLHTCLTKPGLINEGAALICSVFWDLYCAAPERRETCEHSSEAKAFHDYVSDLLMVSCCSNPWLKFAVRQIRTCVIFVRQIF